MRVCRSRRSSAWLVALVFAFATAAPPAMAEGFKDDATKFGMGLVDVTLSRPIGLVRALVGTVFFTGTAIPVFTVNTVPKFVNSALFEDELVFDTFYLDEALQRAVTDPFAHVFRRPLGSFSL